MVSIINHHYIPLIPVTPIGPWENERELTDSPGKYSTKPKYFYLPVLSLNIHE